jgi:hypothetical protein
MWWSLCTKRKKHTMIQWPKREEKKCERSTRDSREKRREGQSCLIESHRPKQIWTEELVSQRWRPQPNRAKNQAWRLDCKGKGETVHEGFKQGLCIKLHSWTSWELSFCKVLAGEWTCNAVWCAGTWNSSNPCSSCVHNSTEMELWPIFRIPSRVQKDGVLAMPTRLLGVCMG